MFYKAWHGPASAYPMATNYKSVREGFKRCRNQQHFILTDSAVRKLKPVCAHCGKVITAEDHNRGIYSPKHKKMVILHYDCSWQVLFTQLFKLAGRLGY